MTRLGNRIRQWRDVPGRFVMHISVDSHTGEIFDEYQQDLNSLRQFLVPQMIMNAMLVIDFVSSGHDNPGSVYGGRDNLGFPPESQDERSLEVAYLETGANTITLPEALQQQLFNFYKSQINDVPIK